MRKKPNSISDTSKELNTYEALPLYSEIYETSLAPTPHHPYAPHMHPSLIQEPFDEYQKRARFTSAFDSFRNIPETFRIHRRKLVGYIGAIAVAGSLATPGIAHAQESYTVKSGDNLSVIAHAHDVSIDQLQTWNPEQKSTPHLINPGEVLTLGAKEKKRNPDVHIVKYGDRLSSIAKTHEITMASLLHLNPQFEQNPDLIHPGDKVLLKKKLAKTEKPAAEKKAKHVVRDSIAPSVAEKIQNIVKPAHEKVYAGGNIFEFQAFDAVTKSIDEAVEAEAEQLAEKEAAEIVVGPKVTKAELTPITLNAFMKAVGLDAKNSPLPTLKEMQKMAKKFEKAQNKIAKKKGQPLRKYTVEEFMAAIVAQESNGDPKAENARTGANGYTQIMPDNWPRWSKEALGYEAPNTPENQVKVSRYKMQQYYDAYEDWSAVAVAWFAGPGRAARYDDGDRSVLHLSDGHWTVGKYVSNMQANIGKVDPYKVIPELKRQKSKKKKSKKSANSVFKELDKKKNKKFKSLFASLSSLKADRDLYSSLFKSDEVKDDIPVLKQQIKKARKSSHNSNVRRVHGIKWSWPIKGNHRISDCWDTPRPGHGHSGIDISAPRGTFIKAAAKGKVVSANVAGGFGNTVFVEHKTRSGGKLYSLYAHMDSFHSKNLADGKVKRGEVIGTVGNTGHSFGDHEHFNIQNAPTPDGDSDNGGTLDPMDYLPKKHNHVNPRGC